MVLAAPFPNPCLAPGPTLSSLLMSELGDFTITSTSMDSHRSSWVLAPSLLVAAGTILERFTRTLGELLMVKDVHLCGAHLVGPTDRL